MGDPKTEVPEGGEENPKKGKKKPGGKERVSSAVTVEARTRWQSVLPVQLRKRPGSHPSGGTSKRQRGKLPKVLVPADSDPGGKNDRTNRCKPMKTANRLHATKGKNGQKLDGSREYADDPTTVEGVSGYWTANRACNKATISAVGFLYVSKLEKVGVKIVEYNKWKTAQLVDGTS